MELYFTPELFQSAVQGLVQNVPALIVLALFGVWAVKELVREFKELSVRVDRMADSVLAVTEALLANTAGVKSNTASTERAHKDPVVIKGEITPKGEITLETEVKGEIKDA